MKNWKSIFIYGILALLCVAAIAGYFITNGPANGNGKEATAAASSEVTDNTQQLSSQTDNATKNEAAATGSVEPENSATIGESVNGTTVVENTANAANLTDSPVASQTTSGEATSDKNNKAESSSIEETATSETTNKAEKSTDTAAATTTGTTSASGTGTDTATSKDVAASKDTAGTAPKNPPAARPADMGSLADPNLDPHVREVMEKSIEAPDPNPVVGIARGEDYAKVTEEAVNIAGGLKDIVKQGDTVLIKPNLCTFTKDKDPRTTDYEAVQKVVDMVRELGAGKVIVAEGTIAGNCFAGAFLEANKYNRIKGAELVNLNAFLKPDCYELKARDSKTKKALFIPKVFMDADVVINVAKLKTHGSDTVSLSLKNSFGVPPGMIYGAGSKDRLHDLGLFNSITDLNTIRKPDFSIIEGIIGGEGTGPLSNRPVKSGIMLAGRDPVALDTVALTFMGFKMEDVFHVKLCGKANIGISDLNSIKVVGAELNDIKMKFKGPYE